MRKCTDLFLIWRGLRRGQATAHSRCSGPASATMSHQTPLGTSMPQANCLDLWREKNDQLVQQAKVMRRLLGPWLCSPQIAERRFAMDLPQPVRRGLSLTSP